jgi:hypothetical protein
MSPTALIEKAKEQGITLLLKEGALLWEGKDDPSPALLRQLRQHKPALRAYLRDQGTVAPECEASNDDCEDPPAKNSEEQPDPASPLASLPESQRQELLSFVRVAKAGGWDLEQTTRYTLPLLPGLTEGQIREAWGEGAEEEELCDVKDDDCDPGEAPPPEEIRDLVEAHGRSLPPNLLSWRIYKAHQAGASPEEILARYAPFSPELELVEVRRAIEREKALLSPSNRSPSPPLAPPHPPEGRLAYLKQHATPDERALIEPPAQLSIAELYEKVKERRDFFQAHPRYLEAIRWRLEEGWSAERVLAYLQEYQPALTLAHIQHAANQEPTLALPRDEGRLSPTAPDLPPQKPVAWSPEAARLIEWFRSAFEVGELPEEPFDLAPWIRVEGPERFYQRLLYDIEEGPAGPRTWYGTLQEDLRRLREVISPSLPAETNLPKPSQQEGSTHSKQAGSFEDTRDSRKEQAR